MLKNKGIMKKTEEEEKKKTASKLTVVPSRMY